MQRLAPHAGRTLGWAIVLVLLPLSPVLGSAASVIASVLAILLAPFVLGAGSIAAVRREPALLIFAAAFAALAVCFAITAREPRDVLFAANFLALPLAAVLYLAARRSDGRGGAVTTVAILCLAGALSALAIALNDILLLHREFVFGFNLGPHVVARVALVMGVLALAGLFVSRSPWRLLFYLGPLAALAVLYLSGTRGAVLAVPVMAIVFMAFLAGDRRDRWQVWVLIVLGLIAAMALVLLSDRIASILAVFGDLLSGAEVSDGSANERLAMLWVAAQLFQASPLVGHGWAHFAADAYPLIGSVVWGGPTDPFFQFHNDLANFAVAGGLVGIASWLGLLAAPVVGALATPRDGLFRVRLYCCLELSAGYLVLGLTDFTLGYDLPTTLYAFLMAIVLGAFRERDAAPGPVAPAMRLAA